MKNTITRGRLLAGAALGLGLAMAPQQAQAACVFVGTTYTCATNTTTTDTNFGTNPPNDRNVPYNIAGPVGLDVDSAVLVDGFGLSLEEVPGGTGTPVTVTNDGTIQVNAGNTPTAGGLDGAFGFTSTTASTLAYSGSGDIVNLGTGDGFEALFTGSGSLTANIGGSVRADAGDAIRVNSTAATGGAIGITTTAGETIRASGGDGIEVDTAGSGNVGIINAATISSGGAGVNTLQDGINVTTTGTGSITINNSGAIGATTDRAQLTGISATINNSASTSGVNIAGTGNIFSVGNAIDVSTNGNVTGDGDISIIYGGALDSSAGDGIQADAAIGDITVTSGGAITAAGDGIDASTAIGDQFVTVNGPVTAQGNGIDADIAIGDQSITTNGAITAQLNGILADVAIGNQTIDVNGAISAQLAGVAANTSIGNQTITIDANVTGGQDGVIANTTSGTVDLDVASGADVAGTAGSGITLSATGASSIDIGTGSIVTGGTQAILLNNTGATAITNAGTIGAASTGLAINASAAGATTITNTGTLNGRVLLGAGADSLTNTGTINTQGTTDFGAGADTFANSGTGVLNLAGATTLANLETFTNSGRINLNTFVLTGPPIAFTNNGFIDTNGNAGLGGFTSFNNAGTLDLAAGTFTVPAAVFTNSGLILADEGATTITGQTSFANSGTLDLQDGVTDDTLTINSDFVGSGASTLAIDFSGTDSDLLVINGNASGSTDVDANYLGGFNLDGVLVVDAVTSAADAFVLGSVTGATPLLDVSLVQEGADYFLVAAPTAAAFNPLVVPGFATDLWYQSADEIFAETVKPATTSGVSFWGEGYISRDKYGDDDDTLVVDGIAFDVDNELKTKRHGLQMGVDYGFDGGGRVGLTGGYAWAKANGNADADLKAKGWNLGLYGQFGGLTGFHGEFLAKHDRYKARFTDGAFDGEKFDIRSTGVDGSLGYRFGMGGAATMDVHAGLSHVRTKVDDINAFGFNYDIAKLTSTRGRAGVRAILGGGMAPYVDATVYREFKGGGDIELFDGFDAYDLDTRGKGTWVRLEAGLSGNNGPGPILAAWGDLGDRKGIGLRAGWRLGGRVAEALPPPPPPAVSAPPPPPPPATQTCPDGSVILATDMCPPPPPPPPPPPEPERG